MTLRKIRYHIGIKTNWDLYFNSNNKQYDASPPTNIDLSMLMQFQGNIIFTEQAERNTHSLTTQRTSINK